MTLRLDRADIQGNVLLPYGRNTFPIGHLLLFHCDRTALQEQVGAGPRQWLARLLPHVTSGELFASKRTDASLPKPPQLTLNVAFTCSGLAVFGVPASTISQLPPEFQEGMRARSALLNDDTQLWDPVWKEDGEGASIDLLIQLRVNFARALDQIYERQCREGDRDATNPGKAAYHKPFIFEKARRLALRRLERRSQNLIDSAARHGLRVLRGHGPSGEGEAANRYWQVMESIPRTRSEDGVLGGDGDPRHVRYAEYEHFGFFDGIADPVFEGQYPPELQAEKVIGQGRLQRGAWQPLPAGEFLLGYPDQAQEMPALPVPAAFSRNGTFLVVRKLHQDVAAFERATAAQLPAFQAWLGPPAAVRAGSTAPAPATPAAPARGPDHADAREQARLLLRAKLVGRWDDGTPLTVAPTYSDWQAFRREHQTLRERSDAGDLGAKEALQHLLQRLRDVRYEPDDSAGSRCPFTAHIRRSNPRDSGDPSLSDQPTDEERQRASSLLANRRRLLRRAMSYGPRWCPVPEAADPIAACRDDGQERGTLFMALCSGLFRQFEFMQQQWLNYGSDFGAGNDVCPISGVADRVDPATGSKLIINADAASHRPPFVLRPAAAVQCRGGAYFFVPSLTALRLIAQGMVDPI
ncbi:MAG: hypothetical protein RLZZ423_1362 [Cyanobacteriota bacterium]|jgi:deferrochelatase/peroxidase EfeB